MLGTWDVSLQIPIEMVNRIGKLNKNSSIDEWQDVYDELSEHYHYRHYICNSKEDDCPFPSKIWTFQHHAAHFNAPESIVLAMIEKMYPMSYKDAEGKMPAAHIAADKSQNYKNLFAPKYGLSNISFDRLAKIEKNFHSVINSRVEDKVKENNLILPSLSVILELKNYSKLDDQFWCPIPGMYGGFSFDFTLNDEESDVVSLETSSWCRVAGGSGQTHKCTEDKWELTDEGFV